MIIEQVFTFAMNSSTQKRGLCPSSKPEGRAPLIMVVEASGTVNTRMLASGGVGGSSHSQAVASGWGGGGASRDGGIHCNSSHQHAVHAFRRSSWRQATAFREAQCIVRGVNLSFSRSPSRLATWWCSILCIVCTLLPVDPHAIRPSPRNSHNPARVGWLLV